MRRTMETVVNNSCQNELKDFMMTYHIKEYKRMREKVPFRTLDISLRRINQYQYSKKISLTDLILIFSSQNLAPLA